MGIAPSPHIAPQMNRGGLSADSMYNRIANMRSRKDPSELKKPKVIPFDLGEYEEDNDGYLYQGLEELKELAIEDSKTTKSADELDEARLPFDDDEYFDINTHDEYFIPNNEFYTNRTKLRNYKTDYQAVSDNPRPTTSGLGTGRATARTRTNFAQTEFPISNKYPGGNIRKLSFPELRRLVSQEKERYDYDFED